MFGVIVDKIYYSINNKKIYYYKNITKLIDDKNIDSNITIVLSLDYNHDKYVNTVSEIGIRQSRIGSEANAKLIHPIIKVYNSNTKELIEVMHLDEELLAEFNRHQIYHDRIFRFLKSYIVIK